MNDRKGRIETFASRLNKAMSERNMNQADLVQKTGIRKQQVSQYVNGLFEAKQQAVFLLAQALNVSEAWLMGYDVTMEKEIPQKLWDKFDAEIDTDTLAKSVNLLELIQEQYGKEAVQLLEAFTQLNPLGQEKALESLSDLTDIPRYTTEDETIYRAARSSNHAAPKTMKRDKERMSRLEKAPKVTKSEDL